MLEALMRTLLRHTETGQFFQGPKTWTSLPETACDFRFIERAQQFARLWELEKVEVAFAFEDFQLICTLAAPAEEIEKAAQVSEPAG